MGRKGPTSLPLGLITPTVAASKSNRKLSVVANTLPAATINMAPIISIRRRPNRSARVVSHKEMAVSPTNVRVRRLRDLNLAQPEFSEIQHQNDGNRSVGEQPGYATPEQQIGVSGE